MFGQILPHQVVEVRPIADSLATPLANKPLPALLSKFPAEHKAAQEFQPMTNVSPQFLRLPAHEHVNMRRLRCSGVQPPASSDACIISDPNHHALVKWPKSHGRLGSVFVVELRQIGVGGFDLALLLHESARMIGIPTSVGVKSKQITRHGSFLNRRLPPAAIMHYYRYRALSSLSCIIIAMTHNRDITHAV
jgi:hypothetical protein